MDRGKRVNEARGAKSPRERFSMRIESIRATVLLNKRPGWALRSLKTLKPKDYTNYECKFVVSPRVRDVRSGSNIFSRREE